jgi:hypothetical protein
VVLALAVALARRLVTGLRARAWRQGPLVPAQAPPGRGACVVSGTRCGSPKDGGSKGDRGLIARGKCGAGVCSIDFCYGNANCLVANTLIIGTVYTLAPPGPPIKLSYSNNYASSWACVGGFALHRAVLSSVPRLWVRVGKIP